jgi:hydroxymethylpyrimidine/phosphomethylpyrimidine kinase
LLSDAAPIVLTAGRLDPTGETGLGLDGAFLSRLGVRTAPVVAVIAVDRALGARPGRAVDPATFADQLAAALDALRGAVRAVHAGILSGEPQAEALAEAARGLGMPLVADLAWRGPGGLGALEDAALVIADAADAARDELAELARALAGPARVAVVVGSPGRPGGGDAAGAVGTPAALAGPSGESIVEAVAPAHAESRSTSGARSIAAAGYLALGLPAADAAAAAHRFVASALVAGGGGGSRLAVPAPWRV